MIATGGMVGSYQLAAREVTAILHCPPSGATGFASVRISSAANCLLGSQLGAGGASGTQATLLGEFPSLTLRVPYFLQLATDNCQLPTRVQRTRQWKRTRPPSPGPRGSANSQRSTSESCSLIWVKNSALR